MIFFPKWFPKANYCPSVSELGKRGFVLNLITVFSNLSLLHSNLCSGKAKLNHHCDDRLPWGQCGVRHLYWPWKWHRKRDPRILQLYVREVTTLKWTFLICSLKRQFKNTLKIQLKQKHQKCKSIFVFKTLLFMINFRDH